MRGQVRSQLSLRPNLLSMTHLIHRQKGNPGRPRATQTRPTCSIDFIKLKRFFSGSKWHLSEHQSLLPIVLALPLQIETY